MTAKTSQAAAETLAIEGGAPVRTTPMGSASYHAFSLE